MRKLSLKENPVSKRIEREMAERVALIKKHLKPATWTTYSRRSWTGHYQSQQVMIYLESSGFVVCHFSGRDDGYAGAKLNHPELEIIFEFSAMPNNKVVKALFEMGIPTEDIEKFTGATISAHQKIEWKKNNSSCILKHENDEESNK